MIDQAEPTLEAVQARMDEWTADLVKVLDIHIAAEQGIAYGLFGPSTEVELK